MSERKTSNLFSFKRKRNREREDIILSKSSSLNSQEIINVMHPDDGPFDTILDGMCRGEPLTDRGKRIKVLKILSVTLLPILSLWAFTVYSLSDSIEGKFDIEQTQYAVKFSVEIGMFLDRIQRERDMSVLYLSILGPETKTFLMNEYLLTDQALDHLSDWPTRNDISNIFKSKKQFRKFLNEHRQNLDPSNYDIYVEMDFYSFLIERFIEWMYGAIRESNMASIWKILVAYQKIVTVMEHIGIERALGTVFYVEGGFPYQSVYELYNNRVNIFKANYRSAVLYSDAVDPIYQGGVTATGTNLTAVIEWFRFEIQHIMQTDASITKGQWWFDNMTLYLDTLLIIQQELAYLINGQLEEIIQAEEQNLTISACFLVIVFLMCPLVIYSVETLTSDIQRYAVALVHKTKELSKEKKKMNVYLFKMVPAPAAELLEKNIEVSAEYFKSVTVMFSDICGLYKMSEDLSSSEIMELLNKLHIAIDERLSSPDVYKVEAINDSYLIVSGAPNRIGNRHSAEIADIALDLVKYVDKTFCKEYKCKLQLRIGINTGPCMSGIVGTMLPRYCVFGETINMACRTKSYGAPNKIHLTLSTYNSLRKHGVYIMAPRGSVKSQDKGPVNTYWLLGKTDEHNNKGASTPGIVEVVDDPESEEFSDNQSKSEGRTEEELSQPKKIGKFGTFEIIKPRSNKLQMMILEEDEERDRVLENPRVSVVENVKGRETGKVYPVAGPSGSGFSPVKSKAGVDENLVRNISTTKLDAAKELREKSKGISDATGFQHKQSGHSGSSVRRHENETEPAGEHEITYDSVGGVKGVEKEGNKNLLHACMSQAVYESGSSLQA